MRSGILAQQRRLRRALGAALDLAGETAQGDGSAGRRLAVALESVRVALEDHVALEERTLIPRLRQADPFGPARVQRLVDEHNRQREELIAFLSDDLLLRSDLCLGAYALEGLLRAMLRHLDDEEREFLGPEMLCDDPVMVDLVSAGARCGRRPG